MKTKMVVPITRNEMDEAVGKIKKDMGLAPESKWAVTGGPATMKNPSGINPLDLRVLVKPDAVADKIGSIFIPDQERERRGMAECRATLVAVGENAFCEVKGSKPSPGQRVLIAKYAGIVTKGDDGEEYRLCNDSDICAVLG
jgi:co-chaperonin GroES (HSP10)